jgi:D-glucosaminate-6-phosphate ammonia-lyase
MWIKIPTACRRQSYFTGRKFDVGGVSPGLSFVVEREQDGGPNFRGTHRMTDSAVPATNADPYLAIGVRPFINCASVRTMHGGSLMLPEVRAAIAAASRRYVNLDELMEGASRRIAELTGAEWGIVTCGSAAALALATAACVAGNDPVRILRLPFTEGWTRRVIMVRNQRFAYDQAIRMVGTEIVEVDSVAALDQAFAEPVAMVAVLGTNEAASPVRLDDIVARARPRGIPVLVDAASEHIARPDPWLSRGADMVIYSGGKFLRGPQTSGLLLGNKQLVQAAWRNASPHQAFGRGMKVSKEDVIGVLAALEVWFGTRDATAEMARWRGDLNEIAGWVATVGAEAKVVEPEGVERVPRLLVRWDAAQVGLDGMGLRQALLEGEPRVMLDDNSATACSIEVDPFGLQPGEAQQVGRSLAAALAAARPAAVAARADGMPELSGEWALRVQFLHGERKHRLLLHQDGATVTGRHVSDQFEGDVAGRVDGTEVNLGLRARYEGSTISYRLKGTAGNGRMQGHVVLGSGSDHHLGPVNLEQFGTASWEAERAS